MAKRVIFFLSFKFFHTCALGGAGPREDWPRLLGEGPPNSMVLSKFS